MLSATIQMETEPEQPLCGVCMALGVKWTQRLQPKSVCRDLVTCSNQTNGMINCYLEIK